MPNKNTTLEQSIEQLLDKHAEYYIRQTVKFFVENGESPALSKNNKGDLEAKQALLSLFEKYGKEVIGQIVLPHAEEKLRINTDTYLTNDEDAQNILIAEQTTRLKQILGGNDE